MLGLFCLFLANARPEPLGGPAKLLTSSKQTENVYCVCEGGKCEKRCPSSAKVISSNSSILTDPNTKLSGANPVVFLLANFEDDPDWVPVFDLRLFDSFSVMFTPSQIGERGNIRIRPGHVKNEKTWGFANVNVYLEKGDYYFDGLETHATKWIPLKKTGDIKISPKSLTTDLESFLNVPKNVHHDPPFTGITIELNESVKNFVFLPEHWVGISVNDSSATFDLSQIPSDHAAPLIKVSSRTWNVSCLMPDMDEVEDFPRIIFQFERSAKVALNFEQFPDELMDLSKRITVRHGNRALFVEAPPGIDPPTIKRDGTGPFYVNAKIKTWFDNYCLCEGDDCNRLCGERTIIEFNDIDKTVIGNPNMRLDYIIAGSSTKNHPKFDLEHFGDRNLTVMGATQHEHVGVFGSAGVEDEGHHFFNGVTVHVLQDQDKSNYKVHFPVVEFAEVNFICKAVSETCDVGSNLLQIDYKSYVSGQEYVFFEPGLLGTHIHTTNVVNLVNIELISEFVIKLNDVKVRACETTRSRITVKTGGNVNVLLGSKLQESPDVGKIPRLTIVTEGDTNFVTFPGLQWPDKLSDITAKVIVVHGQNPLHISGEIHEKDKYKARPPVVAHQGTGPLYFNGILSNYHSRYCVCEGRLCKQDCEQIGPVVSFSEKEITATATGNPSRSIEYVVLNTALDRRPVFGVDHFQVKSFLITGHGNRQYIALDGTDNICPPTSVSHCFKNVVIDFARPVHLCFNNLDLKDVTLGTDKKYDPMEFKINSRGLTADLSSLASLAGSELLSPCTHYMTVLGEDKLSRIFITGQADLRLEDAFKRYAVPIDLELLENPITIVSTGATKDQPLTITWSIEDSSWFKTQIPVPQMRIDLSGIIAEEAHVVFNGRRWEGDYHNISHRVSITYGQTDLHIESDRDRMEGFIGQPPHVKLDGDGDYYINGKKQATFTSPGNHRGDDDDEDDGFSIWGFLGSGLLIGALIGGLVVMFVFRPRNRVSNVPYSMAMPGQERPDDEQELAQFTLDTNVDEDVEVQ